MGYAARFGALEADSSVIGVTVDLEPSLVDHHLMVEPTKCDQVFGVGKSATGPGFDMMDLETMPTVAGIGGAPVAVAMEDGSA
jgi:hypothetical protein